MAHYTVCPVHGCGRMPHPRSRHCYRHTVRSSRYGSPTGKPIQLRSVQDDLRTAAAYVGEYRNHPATTAALQLLDAEVLNLRARTPVRMETEAEYAMNLLRANGITPQALLVRVVGFYLYVTRRPFRSQREEDVALGRLIAHAVPYSAGSRPNGPAMAFLGSVARQALLTYSIALLRKVEQVTAHRRALLATSGRIDDLSPDRSFATGDAT